MTSEGRGGCDDKEGSKLFKLERRRDAKLEDDLEDRSGSTHDVVRSSWSSCRERSNLDKKTSPVGIHISRGLKQSIKN